MSTVAVVFSEDMFMTLDTLVGLLTSVALLAYLTYAMLRPEKF